LSEPERKLVEHMLEQHPELKEEYHRELRMVDMIRANTGLLQLSAVDTTQHRLDKLMKRIGREEQAKAGVETTAAATSGSKTGARGLRQFLHNLLPTFEWLTPTNAIFAGLLIIQAGFLGWFAHSAIAPPENIYNTASVADDQTAVPVVKGMVLLVDFNGEAQLHQVRDFLLQWNARILDGPDANNLFRIEVKDVLPSDQRSDVILQQMGQDQSIVAFIGREY
jgi:hypothetical protein